MCPVWELHLPHVSGRQLGRPVPSSRRCLPRTPPVFENLDCPGKSPQGFNVNLVTTDRVSALHEACLGGHVACAKVLLENGAQVNAVTIDGITPLFNACCSGSVACVNMLLEFGAKPQLRNHLASPIHEAVKRGHRECMEILLAHEVDIDQEDLQHGTPLYVACMYQRTDCVKKLLELGANVNIGKRLDTPLHAAARKSSVEVVVLLTDYGANTKCRNAELKCPLDLAVPKSKVEQALLLREVVGLGVLVLAFFSPQVLLALPSCAGCASESIWVGRAYMQSTSCTCLSHLRTFFFIDKSVTIFTPEKKEEQMVFLLQNYYIT
ncbi:ankyrin repeat and SOCS box protein 11 isoform X5 [Rissa tridactyla]|uniref:ankyrin repeat and SOCS box protein 11 isoform X5 n=1 Tax=Rissa tridactyla TaxID=75485 RepID=UPI0023BA7299|nr:ankyrin repeat and SOCS box protein 11 isoform X5 [Rissa tridactyla]